MRSIISTTFNPSNAFVVICFLPFQDAAEVVAAVVVAVAGTCYLPLRVEDEEEAAVAVAMVAAVAS